MRAIVGPGARRHLGVGPLESRGRHHLEPIPRGQLARRVKLIGDADRVADEQAPHGSFDSLLDLHASPFARRRPPPTMSCSRATTRSQSGGYGGSLKSRQAAAI